MAIYVDQRLSPRGSLITTSNHEQYTSTKGIRVPLRVFLINFTSKLKFHSELHISIAHLKETYPSRYLLWPTRSANGRQDQPVSNLAPTYTYLVTYPTVIKMVPFSPKRIYIS